MEKNMGLNRFFLLTSLLVFMFSNSLFAGELESEKKGEPNSTYSLNDLYILALDQAESIKIAKENIYIAEKDKSRALSVLIPQISAFGSYSISDTDQTTDPTIASETYDLKTDSMAYGVRFDQSLTLNGKELIALKISKDNIERSQQDLNTVRESYLLEVATAYYNVLRVQKGWEIAKANVKRLEKHKESVSTRLKLDDVTKTDMYRAESELSDAQAKLIEDQNRYILSKSALRSLVILPADFKLNEPEEMTYENVHSEIDGLTHEGLNRRPEIKSAELNQVVAERSIKLSKGDRWPVLSIEGQYAKSNDTNDGTMGGTPLDYDKDVSGYMLAAKLSFTLFDGGLRNAEIKQSYARERQARFAVVEMKKKIELEIQDAYLNVSTQKGRMASLKDKLTFSQQNFKAVSEMFKHGLANSVDMMDANTLLVASERELSEAQFGYKLAVLKLKRASGDVLISRSNAK